MHLSAITHALFGFLKSFEIDAAFRFSSFLTFLNVSTFSQSNVMDNYVHCSLIHKIKHLIQKDATKVLRL
jgi:hypothetical protein